MKITKKIIKEAVESQIQSAGDNQIINIPDAAKFANLLQSFGVSPSSLISPEAPMQETVQEGGESKTITVYHGTNDKFENFDLDKTSMGDIWFTDSKESILNGTSGAGLPKYILVREITLNNPAGWDEYEKYGLQELIQQGFDGVALPEENKTDYIVFNPESIKKVSKKQDLDERRTDDKFKFDTENGPLTIRIPKSKVKFFAKEIVDYTNEMGEKIHDIKNWYINAHNFIKQELGDDAPLFLMLLGVTSKSRSVVANLITCKTLYYRLKNELVNNREKVIAFVHDENFKFGSGARVDDTEYGDLSFLQMTQDIMGLLPDFKNINKILRFYFSKGEKISFDDAIMWMKSFFNVQGMTQPGKKTLDKANSVSGHKLFNYTMNLLDPLNEKSPEHSFVTIDRHMIKYFIPKAADEKLSEFILSKVFSDVKGMYYALSLLINDITKEVQKTFPEMRATEVQPIAWFIARERYSDAADNADGGTYQKEFAQLQQFVSGELNELNKASGELSFEDVSKYVSKKFKHSLAVKNHLKKDDDLANVPF